jgi:uncharacterized membrane-anchored protein YitT (DUF2179 family)
MSGILDGQSIITHEHNNGGLCMKKNGIVTRPVVFIKENISFRDIFSIFLGTFIMALAIKAILIPANLVTGGVAGIAMVLEYHTGIEVWIWYLVLNAPIFFAGYRLVSTRFVLYSLLGTFSLSLFLAVIQSVELKLDEPLLAAVLGGVISGLGLGMVLLSRGSTGGTDIIAVVFRRLWGHNIGQVLFMSNLLVLVFALTILDLEMVLFSAITIYVSGRVVDAVELGFWVNRTAIIVSEKSDMIAQAVLDKLHRGCTFLVGKGAYSGEDKKIIMVTIARTQLPRLTEIIFQLDPGAFITVNEAVQVYGKGFKDSHSEF